MADEQDQHNVSVPAFIVTEWDDDGEPSVYKPIAACSAEEIRAHVFDLRRKARALQDDIVNLALYATGALELDKDEPEGTG